MGVVDAARRHFGGRWKPDIRVMGREAFKLKLTELQNEITQLQRCCERLRMADQRDPKQWEVGGSDIRIVRERVEAELAALHGWTVSLVETVFVLVDLESSEETQLRKEWKANL
jgi:hypothetical protein